MLISIKKILKEDNFLSLAGNLVIAVFGLGGFALLARTLNPEQFAQWVIFISGGSMVEMVRFGITNNALVRFLSGASEEESEQLIGSNVLISLVSTAGIAAIMMACNFIFEEAISSSVYALFFTWYPLLAFVNLPWNNAMIVLQAKMEYGKILGIKTLNSGLFFLFLILNKLVFNVTIVQLIWVLIIINLISTVICICEGWDGLIFIRKANKATNTTLLNFGKYSTFTLIGTNLLRNADLLIISISPLGSAAVALFSIPLKLTELQQIPLRSFAATAFPKMSKASLNGNVGEVRKLFYDYCGALTYLFALMSLTTFVFAEQFVILISGFQYLNSEAFDIVTLVRLFSIYGLLLPIDRMTGIGLDSVNKPHINAVKVIIMLAINIMGDLVAVFIFKSLAAVAIATLLFTTAGIVVGAYCINKEFDFSIIEIFKSGNRFYANIWNQFNQTFRGLKFLKD
ncbi:oligosaccharide flippase family protein [Flavobacterium sp. CYK-4]|uniref:lipopolysaccharide biosynthesis protein n=1 Tax=Flavobacterium lotistagni TaxID=2709660 RepID=UPI00140BB9B2|nr:oligosaccharide flippase family protein [Flavobacterium lotistagni]NHM07411.1 oligosaccharide flippase family protein [Flavobacterium lotistagni]